MTLQVREPLLMSSRPLALEWDTVGFQFQVCRHRSAVVHLVLLASLLLIWFSDQINSNNYPHPIRLLDQIKQHSYIEPCVGILGY